MKMNSGLILITLLLTGAEGCKKNTAALRHDLYLTGTQASGDVFYIKNKTRNQTGLKYYDVTGPMFADGDDIYFPFATGYIKNGEKVRLQHAGSVRSVFVSEGSVYAAGNTLNNNAPAYWKDGELVLLDVDPAAYGLLPSSIIVSGRAVYVGGQLFTTSSSGGDKVIYWQNGILNRLGDGFFKSMHLAGTDLYIGGQVTEGNQYLGIYWKNGIRHNLYTPNGSRLHNITSLFANGTDIYVTGESLDKRVLYWKNDEPVLSGQHEGNPVSVVVDNNSVYVLENYLHLTGSSYHSIMILWNDNQPDTLFEANATGMQLGTRAFVAE